MRKAVDRKSEAGVVMLEALIVYTVTVFLLFFILTIFSVLFQRWNIQTIANETAMRFAQTYRYQSVEDDSSGYVTTDDIAESRPYRYVGGAKTLENAFLNNAKRYGGGRLSRTTFTRNIGEPEFKAVVKSDALARKHVELSISGEYTVPFGEMLSYFGFDSTISYKTTAYAQCVDLIDYVNTTDFVKYQAGNNVFDSKLVGLVNAVLKLFDNIID